MSVLTVSALRWMERHRRRAALRRLLEQDDHILEDLGLVRAEIQAALHLPVDVDALAEARRASARTFRLDRRA